MGEEGWGREGQGGDGMHCDAPSQKEEVLWGRVGGETGAVKVSRKPDGQVWVMGMCETTCRVG